MILISCHIDGFGAIQNKDFSFNSRLNCFCSENGSGKTTLAAFIKAMFYSMPSYKSNTTDFTDRKHYNPLSGAKYGGNLIFSHKGSEYRIERVFDKMSERKDEFSLFKDGSVFGLDANTTPGKYFFGIDKEAFERILFVTADEIKISATGEIAERLSSVIGGDIKSNNFGIAKDNLEKAVKEYKASRGNNDKISHQKKSISELKAQISDKEKECVYLSGYYKQCEKLRDEISKLNSQINEAGELEKVREQWKNYDGLIGDIDNAEKQIAEYKEKYKSGIPDESTVDKLLEEAYFRSRAEENKNERFSDSKREELKALSEKFREHLPDDEEFESVQKKISELVSLNARLPGLENDGLSEHDKNLSNSFSRGIPSDEKLEEFQKESKSCDEKNEKLRELTTVPETVPFPKAIILSLVFFVIGMALAYISTIVGCIIAIPSLGCSGILFIRYLSKKSKIREEIEKGRLEQTKLADEIKESKSKTAAFLASYGYIAEGNHADFVSFRKDITDYKQLDDRRRKNKEEKENLKSQIQTISDCISKFFSAYGFDEEDYQKLHSELKEERDRYLTLSDDENEFKKNAAEIEEKLRQVNERLNSFFSESGIGMDGDNYIDKLNIIKKDIITVNNLIDSAEQKKKNAEAYKRDNSLTERPDAAAPGIGLLTKSLSDKQKEQLSLDKIISEREKTAEELEEKKRDLKEKTEELDDMQSKRSLLEKTLDCLKRADLNIRNRYISPVKEAFEKYAGLLEATFGNKCQMDENLSVRIEKCGQLVPDEHLSRGEKSICMLCFRLALTDNLYNDDKPFIIMDDPFTDLDGFYTEKALKVLEELSKDRQIIYFCCHESRKMT